MQTTSTTFDTKKAARNGNLRMLERVWANPAVSYIGVLTPQEERLVKMRDAGYSVDECAMVFGYDPRPLNTRGSVREKIIDAESNARKRIAASKVIQ